ncbi:MAG: hypothetical protein ACI9H8_000060 [Lysobacterales bacterium]|jgi:hypothetical protein
MYTFAACLIYKIRDSRTIVFFINYVSILLVSASLFDTNPTWVVRKNGDMELDGNTINDGAAVVGIEVLNDIFRPTTHAFRSIKLPECI